MKMRILYGTILAAAVALAANGADFNVRANSRSLAVVRDLTFSNIHATGLQFPFFEGRPGNALKNFTLSNCSFRKLTDEDLPDWMHHGGAPYQRAKREPFAHVEGFVYSNVRFDNP